MKKTTFFILTVVAIMACSRDFTVNDIKTGDILFTGEELLNPGDLSTAINEVTRTALETNYTHMGIAKVTKNRVYVIHADPRRGVYQEPLEEFLARYSQVDVFRVNNEFSQYLPEAINIAISLLGKPYDDSFIIGSGGHYCSGLIYTLFSNTGVFELAPMTFKDPSTGEFHSMWVEHYARLGIEIPEGLPGCNPNGMAASTTIHKVGTIGL